jgi:hypothetical protein
MTSSHSCTEGIASNSSNLKIKSMDFMIEFLNITTPDNINMETLDTGMNFEIHNQNNIGSTSSGLQEESIGLWISLIFVCLVQITLNYIWTACK